MGPMLLKYSGQLCAIMQLCDMTCGTTSSANMSHSVIFFICLTERCYKWNTGFSETEKQTKQAQFNWLATDRPPQKINKSPSCLFNSMGTTYSGTVQLYCKLNLYSVHSVCDANCDESFSVFLYLSNSFSLTKFLRGGAVSSWQTNKKISNLFAPLFPLTLLEAPIALMSNEP